MASETGTRSFSCYCLNVVIDDAAAPGPPTFPPDEAYSAVYVGEEGVRVAHTQFTARSRGLPRVANASGRPNIQEFSVILSCLICNTVVYRVWWEHHPTLDGDSTSLLISGEWAEGDTLRSRSGWIEVKHGCPSGPAVTKLLESASYSSLFRILLPSTGQLTPPSSTPPLSYATTSRTPSESGYVHLPSLPALFLPAPFTSPHPAFVHLTTVATGAAQQLRDAAEEELALATQKKLVELEHAEQELKRQVEVIWHTFRESVRSKTQAEQAAALGRVRSPTRTVDPVLDFVPVPDTLPLSPPTSPGPRKSALAASLRQSGMQYVPRPQGPASAQTDVSQSVPVFDRHARWSTDESANVAASLHWSTLEQNMRKERESLDDGSKLKDIAQTAVETNDSELVQPEATKLEASTSSHGESRRKPEGRKVKFDARPDVVTVTASRTARQATATSSIGTEDSIFDFDIETGTSLDVTEDDEDKPVEVVQPLPAIRQLASPPPAARRGAKRTPLSFSSLRPSSLPAPSHMQLSKLQEVVKAPKSTPHSPRVLSPPPLQDREQNTAHDLSVPNVSPPPGKDGRAWEIYARNKGGKTIFPSGTAIEEEDENEPISIPRGEEPSPPAYFSDDLGSPEDVSTPSSTIGGIPRSVPIPVGAFQARRFQDMDYEPKTSLADRPGMRVPKLRTAGMPSSVAIRKANYAARDRQKGTDPGAFDFVSDDTDEEEDDSVVEASERARQQAFNILKARSELPAAGMWRSLA